MSDPNPTLTRPAIVPDHPAAAAMVAQPVLNELVGAETALVSMGLECGADLLPGESVEVTAAIVRGTRTLIFARATLVKGSGEMAADISAVFRRQSGPEKGN